MNKNVTHRIAYYTKKVAQKVSIHPAKMQPRSYTYRNKRLLQYKKLMHDEIAKTGY
jgi:hypothetical protein